MNENYRLDTSLDPAFFQRIGSESLADLCRISLGCHWWNVFLWGWGLVKMGIINYVQIQVNFSNCDVFINIEGKSVMWIRIRSDPWIRIQRYKMKGKA